MPIVTISQYVPEQKLNEKTADLQLLALALRNVFKSTEGSVWVRLHRYPQDCFARDSDTHSPPIICNILMANPVNRNRIEALSSEISRFIGEFFNHPQEMIDLIFEPSGTGRVVFGGTLI